MTDDILNSATSTTQSTETNPLAELVGEDKKYSSVEALAESRIEADKHIKHLEFENKNMREEIEKLAGERENSKTIEDILEALNTRKQGNESNNQSDSGSANVEDVVKSILNQERQASTAKENYARVNSTIAQAFNGDNEAAAEHVKKVLAETNITGEQLNRLSESSPDAALKVLGLNSQTKTQTMVSPTAVSENSAPRVGGEVRNYKYYQALKKEMGTSNFHNDIKLNAQMLRDADEQGDAFYNTE